MAERAEHTATANGEADGAPRRSRARVWVWRVVRGVVAVGAPVVIVWAVWRSVGGIDFRETARILADVDERCLLLSVAAALCALLCMGLYDVFAFPDTGRLRWRDRWRTGSVVFAWSNFLTLGPLGGPAIRLLLYRRAGMRTEQVLRGVTLVLLSSSCGLAAWVIAASLPIGHSAWDVAQRAAVAAALSPALAVIAGRLGGALLRKKWAPPGDRTMATLGLVSALEWAVAATSFALAGRAVGESAPVAESARALLLGQAVGMVSMTPGGLGSADAVWVQVLSSAGQDEEVAAAHAVAFRAAFYLTPWTLSLPVLIVVLRRRGGPDSRGA